MELDYVADVNEFGESLIRLYNFDMAEAQQLSNLVQDWLRNPTGQLNLAELEFITPINCVLLFHIGEEDEGILTVDDQTFFCIMTPRGFKEMLVLMEPFCQKESKAYQVLYDLDIPIDFLIHPSGSAIVED